MSQKELFLEQQKEVNNLLSFLTFSLTKKSF